MTALLLPTATAGSLSVAWLTVGALTVAALLAAAAAVAAVWVHRLRRELTATRAHARESSRLLAEQSQVVAAVVHDLRHPLAGIHAHSQMLAGSERLDISQISETFRMLITEVEHVAGLTQDLLLASTATDGHATRQVDTDLATLAWDATTAWRLANPRRSISVNVGDDVTLTAPPRWLRRIVDNLLSNALTHSPEGTPIALRVGLHRRQAFIEVANVAEGDLAAAAFVSRRTGSGKTGGTGIGLHTIASLANGLNGRVVHDYDPPTRRLAVRVEVPAAAAPAAV